jgi:hypothetical protein
MTPRQFAAAIDRTRLQQRGRRVARLVLVDGHSKSDAARAAGITPQAVAEVVRRVELAHRAVTGCPAEWECVTVCVPSAAVDAVRAIERRERRRAKLTVD